MQRLKNLRLTLFLSFAALAAMLAAILFPASSSLAEVREKPLVACDQNESIGSVFYDFDALYIYYAGFMSVGDRSANFPEELKFANFNAKLIEAIKKNFALCLKTAGGEAKPIVVIPPHHIKMPEKPKYDPKMIHNPKNLTLVITGDYFTETEIAPGVKGSGHIFSYWYRPEVSDKHSRLPIGLIGGVLRLPPLNGTRSIEGRLETFFNSKQPRKTPTLEEFRQGAGRIRHQ